MVAISYFFYKLMLVDFSVMFYVYSVYTKEVMPTKSARVLAECAIANIMRFMEHSLTKYPHEFTHVISCEIM